MRTAQCCSVARTLQRHSGTLLFNAREIMPHIAINEVQRYLFTANQAFRYGLKYAWESKNGYYTKVVTGWGLRAKFSEPVFLNYSDYSFVNFPALKGTACAHSAISENFGSISYLKFWQAHKNVEALIKCGLYSSVKYNEDMIDWAETEPHKMLGVTKDVMRAIRKGQIGYRDYLRIKEEFPKITNLDRLIETNKHIGYSFGILDSLKRKLKTDKYEIAKYILKQNVNINDYSDYVRIGWQKNFSKKKTEKERKDERKESLETAFDACMIDGKVTLSGMAEYMGVTEKTVRNRIKEHGGFWIDDNEVGKKSK